MGKFQESEKPFGSSFQRANHYQEDGLNAAETDSLRSETCKEMLTSDKQRPEHESVRLDQL